MEFFDGTIYLIRIYDKALTQEEIIKNYNYDNRHININETYYTEQEIPDNYYTIASVSEFERFRDEVNNGNTFTDIYVELTTDLDLANIENWQPIGSSEHPFKGIFDGNGHNIYHLNISGENNYQGLFGSNAGVIQNLHIKSGNIKGNYRIGGITGMNTGFIINCNNEAEIYAKQYNIAGICGYNNGGVVERCVNLGNLSSNGTSLAGICGRNDGGIIKYCSNQGILQSTSYAVGGIVGTICGGKVSSCYNTGDISTSGYTENYNSFIAGIVGVTDKSNKTKKESIIYCYNTGNITSAGCHGAGISSDIGGIVSYCYNTGNIIVKRGNESNNTYGAGIVSSISIISGSTVKCCYNIGKVTGENGTKKLGGIVGYNIAGSIISNCYTLSSSISTTIANNLGTSTNNLAKSESDMKTSNFISLIGGEEHWQFVDNAYPKLIWE